MDSLLVFLININGIPSIKSQQLSPCPYLWHHGTITGTYHLITIYHTDDFYEGNQMRCIQHQRSSAPATHSKTQEALNDTLAQQPIDEDSAKVLILRLAAEQYAAQGNEEYETNRLRRLFSAFECVAELNADLLKSTVSEVLVTRQNVKLRLKNGQVIERSDLQ